MQSCCTFVFVCYYSTYTRFIKTLVKHKICSNNLIQQKTNKTMLNLLDLPENSTQNFTEGNWLNQSIIYIPMCHWLYKAKVW